MTTALAAAGFVLLSGCEKPSLRPEAAGPAASPTTEEVKGENPYSIDIVRQAYANLAAKRGASQPQDLSGVTTSSAATGGLSGGAVAAADLQPTHTYLRFKPADINQLADLGDLGFNLSWEPMDESVAATTTVNYQSDEIPWIYTVVPVGTALPTYIQSQQIQQLYLYNEEDGDKKDNPDPWQPPTPCQEFDPSCRCYIPCATEVYKPGNPKVTQPDKLSSQALATANLKKAGIAPRDLTAEAMRLSGHADEVLPDAGQTASGTYATQLFGGRYHPKGKIQVQDTDFGLVPLRGVEVKSRRWFQFGSAFTDNQGNFTISTSYSSLAKLSLQFKNDLATTRGIVSGLKFWEAVLPIKAEIGSYEKSAMENVSYNISHISGLGNQGTKGASVWTAASLFNTLADDNNYSAARGIPGPTRGINVWLLPDFPPKSGPGVAPMLRKIASTAVVSQAIDFLLTSCGLGSITLLKQILQRQLPDVCIRYAGDGGALFSHQLQPLLYHELGHTQHYSQVGNNFWTSYIQYTIIHGGYGAKSDYDAGRIAISEGWGNYTERLFTIDHYQNTSADFRAIGARDELENQQPTDDLNTYNKGWLVYGMYYDMTDGGTEPTSTQVADNVTAFNTASVYRGLQPGVISVRGYQSAINYQNSGLQSSQME